MKIKDLRAILLLVLVILSYYLFFFATDKVPVHSIEPFGKYPHDNKAFTQGFESYNGLFYEGTGLRGESELRKVNPSTGEVINKIKLDPQYFGEGITILDGKIYQLTWQSGTGFIYDLEDFSLIREFQIEGEGWGLTNDGKNLLLSNGSDKIMFLDPLTLKIKKKISITLDGKPQYFLNELELIKGEIWANIWKKDDILRIDKDTGNVVSILDLSNISERTHSEDVANGIAWDKKKDILYLTGKFWKNVYKLKINESKIVDRSIFEKFYNTYRHLIK